MARRPLHVAVFAVLALLVCAGAAAAAPKTIRWSKLGPLHAGRPPWGNDSALLPRRLRLLGLHALPQEGTAEHIHAHLDLYVAGRRVTVPALVGIDVQDQFITELHTHDTTGIIHIESPRVTRFTLGQFFGEWGVKLTSRCVGRYCSAVHWWVDGKPRGGDPAALVLRPHQEIAIAVGRKPARVPASYAFPLGD